MRRAALLRSLGAVPLALSAARGALATPSSPTLTWYAERLHNRGTALESGAQRTVPAASVIKLLIARTIVGELASRRLAFGDGVPLRGADRVGGSDRYGAVPPGRYPLAGLLEAMLSLSDNTAANALLHLAGMDACNACAAELGLAATRFRRTFYDWDAQRRGLENTTTAFESARLLAELVTHTGDAGRAGEAARIALRALLGQTDRETIPAALPGRRGIANKTGELPGIRNDVAIVGYGTPNAYVLAIMCRYPPSTGRAAAIGAIRRRVEEIDRLL
ncbi:MAG TPA: serine hydrolase [Candidatus Elarobacter sp.]|nr:serine hydrolase [Candidatus Elarobacter sp.]